MGEHDGWSNPPTWMVHRGLTSDSELHATAREVAQQGPDALRQYVEVIVAIDIASLASDLLTWALDFVDWEEVTRALMAE
jgi:beta-lactamase regulating signal transducer with metallopeptidase domain